jgi:hypothetical protein
MTDKDVGTRVDRAAAEVDGEVSQVVDLGTTPGGQQRRTAEIVAG